MVIQPIWREIMNSDAVGCMSVPKWDVEKKPPGWPRCSVTGWCMPPLTASFVLATAGRNGVRLFTVWFFCSIQIQSSGSKSAFRVWPSVRVTVGRERWKVFMYLAWWISMDIRQPQGDLVCMDVLPSTKVSHHGTNWVKHVQAGYCQKSRVFCYGHPEQIETMLENSQLLFLCYFLQLLLCQDSELLGQLGGIPHLSKQQNHRCRVC